MISLKRRLIRFISEFDTQRYWEQRYAEGGNSGEGSYGVVAEFKASVLNQFVAENDITSVVEFGCGDGHQLSLAKYPRYMGLDISKTAIERCARRFREDFTKSFLWYSPHYFRDPAGFIQADLALSLEVVFHLIEDDLFEGYMRHLFGSALRYVIIFSSDTTETAAGDKHAPHVKHRKFTAWIADNFEQWSLIKKVPSDELPSTFSDFYIFEKER
jgi:hypothetical protein